MIHSDLDDSSFDEIISSADAEARIPLIDNEGSFDSLRQQEQEQNFDYFPLTQESLQKRNELDGSIHHKFIPVEHLVQCHGSISIRNNRDNSTTHNGISSSKNLDASINSPNCRSVRLKDQFTNNRDDEFSGNTESIDSSRGHRTECSSHTNRHDGFTQHGPPRRFSQLVRLSANHITMGRTRKNRKRKHHSYFYTFFSKMYAIASRVVNTRTSEPADRMTISELISLSKYLYALKYGGSGDDHSSASSNSSESVSIHVGNKKVTRNIPSAVEELENVNNSSLLDVHHNNRNKISHNTPAKVRKHISSLGNIFPFASIDRVSLSGSESSESVEATENDRLLPNATPAPNYYSFDPSTVIPKKKFFKKWIPNMLKYIKYDIVEPMLSKNHQQLHTNTQIRFDGWSLFVFSPTSLTRFFLWRIVGSRQFELLILLLLFCQWMLLSLVPIRFNVDQPFFSRSADYVLFIINMVFTLEAIAKIIVYGLLLSVNSHSKPTIPTLVQYFREPKIYPNRQNEENVTSRANGEDHNSIFRNSLKQSHVPAFTATRSISSDNNSLINDSTFSVASGRFNDNSTRSIYPDSDLTDHPIPPWASTSTKSRTNKYKTYIQDEEEEETWSILTTAERQVRASIYSSSHDTLNSEYDGGIVEFLKVNHQPYLTSVANVLDLLSITSYWIDVVALLFYNSRPWSVFQAMAAMRLFRFFVITEGTTVIMNSLRSSYDMLKNVLGFFMFFWLLFSLIALFIFMNAFNRRCAVLPAGQSLVKNMTDFTYVEPRISCSGYKVTENQTTGVFDLITGYQYPDPGGDGLYCKVGQICIQDSSNQPGYGYISFENIFFSMLNILTVISTEDWTDLLYMSQDSVSEVSAAFFYSFCIYLMSFIMVPMFIAVITTSFAHARGDMRESAFSLKRKAKLILTSSKTKVKDRLSDQGHSENDDEEDWVYSSGRRNIFYRRSKLHDWAHRIIQRPRFLHVGNILVATNVVFMMFHDPKNMKGAVKVERLYTIVFLFEIAIRIVGSTNWRQFWNSQRNRFDLVIAVATTLEEIIYVRDSQFHVYLLIFKVLRSYRVAYLFPGVLNLISDVLGDGQGLLNLTFFTFLVLSLLAPISVQLFGGDFDFNDVDEPSMRFDNFYQAFIALFQIMTGENWTDILYDAMHSQEHDSVTYAALFMVFLYFTVHYMVLNLFIAVIMENFDLDEDEIKQIQIKKYIREHRWKPEYFKMDQISRFLLPFFITQDKQFLNFKGIPQDLVAHVTKSSFFEFLSEETLPSRNNQDYPSSSKTTSFFSFFKPRNTNAPRPPSIVSFKSGHSRKSSIASQYSGKSLRLDPLPSSFEVPILGNESSGVYNDEYELNVAKENKAVIMENLNKFRSLIVLKEDNFLRKYCISIANSKRYKWCQIMVICISALLAMWADEYNRKNHHILNSIVVEPIQNTVLVLSCVDMLIHMIADGVLMLPKSYLRNIWNIFDVLNLVAQIWFSISELANHKSNFAVGNDGCLRIFRAFRLMRLVYYVQGMRVIFLDVIYGFPKMVDVVALNLLVFVTFAIYGCYIFSGKFALCNDESTSSINSCYGEFMGSDDENTDILLPRVWKNPYDYSFDSFEESLLHLFECASGEGWILSLFSAMSVPNSPGEQPKFNWGSQSTFNSIFYIVFMFVASLCSIQLFIGVFLEIFKQRSGISSLTNTQRQFQDLQRQLALVKPFVKVERPVNRIRAFFYDLIIDKRGKFTRFMTVILSLNIMIFTTEYLHQPPWLTYIQNTLNSTFLLLYVVEIGSKIIGLGFSRWFSVLWNVYDFTLVGMAIGTSVSNIYTDLPFGWNIARKLIFVGIAFRLAQRNESLDTLFRSVKRALPSIFYVSAVFAIVIACFGVTFQEHFATTKFGPYGNEHANFRTLFNSVLTLFRITTGENWDFLMHDFAVLPPECVGTEDCGSPKYAFGFFIVFYVVCTFIFVNLFTVIVIDNFSFTFDKRNRFTLITRTDLRKFKEAWALIDPQATGYIDVDNISRFLQQLEGALSLRIYDEEHSISALLDASNRVDNDFRHLVSFPLSNHRMTHNFMENNMQEREQYFNFYEVNRCLSNIDASVIQERKKEYALIYQEILESATYRGIAFQRMLDILAMRLIDASKSLTFEQLVNRARVQDKIYKEIAAEKAKGLVAMLVQRREYVKALQKAKIHGRKVSNETKKVWPSPVPPNESSPVIQLRRTDKKSQFVSNKGETEGLLTKDGSIPTINIEGPQQSAERGVTFSSPVHIPRAEDVAKKSVPKGLAFSDNRSNSRFHRHTFNTSAISYSLGDILYKSISHENTNHENHMTSPPKLFVSTTSEEPDPHASSASSPTSSNNLFGRNYEASNQNINDIDVFTQYYSVKSSVDDMTGSEAELILDKFRSNSWSELLHSDFVTNNGEPDKCK